MARTLRTVQKNISREQRRRVWDVQFRTEIDTDYEVVIKSEVVNIDDGVAQTPGRRDGLPPVVGSPANGKDGTQPEHYLDADGGVPPVVRIRVSELEQRPGGVTYSGTTVPWSKFAPLIAAAINIIVDEASDARRDKAVQQAAAHAQQNNGQGQGQGQG